jgi:hypothetical protein
MLSRRAFIKLAIAGGVTAAAARALYGPFESQTSAPADPEGRYTTLTDSGREILAALTPVFLDGALPAGEMRQTAIRDLLRAIDASYSLMPPAVRGELAQLFQLLAFPAARRILAGVYDPWHLADPAQIRGFIERWRNGSLSIFAQGYQGLRSSVIAIWYAQDAAWQRIGYRGPARYTAPEA